MVPKLKRREEWVFCSTREQTSDFSEEDWDGGGPADENAAAAQDDGDARDRTVNFIAAARVISCSSTTLALRYTKQSTKQVVSCSVADLSEQVREFEGKRLWHHSRNPAPLRAFMMRRGGRQRGGGRQRPQRRR